MTEIPGVLRIFDPAPGAIIPVLVDSPHSGRVYPADFRFSCNKLALERYEDRFVDRLVETLPAKGATVVLAQAPRSYIDLNRAHDDFSIRQIAGDWDGPFPTRPSDYARRGIGLIWDKVDDTPIYDYDARPDAATVMERIEMYYEPYYKALEDRAALLRARFGRFCHLNVHSMPPTINAGRTDIVLGDLEGQSCSHDFLQVVAGVFENAGLRVAVNQPYKGARLTELFGRPQKASESLQIEISKALYLKPDLMTLDDGPATKLQGVMEKLVAAAGDYAASANTLVKDSLSAASKSSIETRLPSAASDVTP